MNLFQKRIRPNIIMILIDQFRNDRINAYPIFDELRTKGTLFQQMITYAPYTIASTHAMLSGLYGTKNGVNAYYKALNFNSKDCHTLQEYLKENGYFTLVDTGSEIEVPKQGFDLYLIHDENKVDIAKRHKQIIKSTNNQHKKYFLLLHCPIIHRAMVQNVFNKYNDFDKDYFTRKEENAVRYDSYAREASIYLQNLIQLIKDSKLFENTLVIVCTDHGCSLGEKPGEKAYGVYLYEYTIRTWAFFIFPKLLPREKIITNLVRTVDMTPTILDILGITEKSQYTRMHGESLLPMILGEETDEREAYVETGGLGGPNPSTHEPNLKCIRTREWKLIYNKTTREKELYNIAKDQDESHNLIGQFPHIENKLWRRIQYHSADGS